MGHCQRPHLRVIEDCRQGQRRQLGGSGWELGRMRVGFQLLPTKTSAVPATGGAVPCAMGLANDRELPCTVRAAYLPLAWGYSRSMRCRRQYSTSSCLLQGWIERRSQSAASTGVELAGTRVCGCRKRKPGQAGTVRGCASRCPTAAQFARGVAALRQQRRVWVPEELLPRLDQAGTWPGRRCRTNI